MDSNETIRPLTEVPVEQTSETLVSSSATAEENNATYVPKQTKEEVIERLKEINEDACNADYIDSYRFSFIVILCRFLCESVFL
jgi:hypothetical protein